MLGSLLAAPELGGTEWSIVVRRDGRVVSEVNADTLLRTASVAKLFVLVELAARLEDGRIQPGTPLRRTRVPAVADSGLWQHLATDTLPVEDVAVLIGAVSDNWATNALLDVLGLDAVTARAEQLAPGGSRLLDVVRDVRLPEHAVTLSVGCASDWASFMEGLHAGRVVGPAVSRRVRDWLARGLDHSMVAGAFGLDPLAHVAPDRGFAVWAKTGTDDGVRADVGCVTGPGGIASYAAICTWDPAGGDPRDAVLVAMREIGAHIRVLVS